MGIAEGCRLARISIVKMVTDLPDEGRGIRVPACPDWSVRDLLGHGVGLIDDVIAGRIARFPMSDAETRGQVTQWDSMELAQLLEQWGKIAPPYERWVEERMLMPGLFDIVSHEQDVRGALGLPGGRESEAIRTLVDFLLSVWPAERPVRVRFEEDDTVAPAGGWQEGGLELVTTRWEFFRWNSGRRSPRQAAAMRWSAPPGDVAMGIGVFALAPDDVLE